MNRAGKSWFHEKLQKRLLETGGVVEQDYIRSGLRLIRILHNGKRYLFVRKALPNPRASAL